MKFTAAVLFLLVSNIWCIPVRADTISFEQAVATLDAAHKLQQEQLHLWRGEPEALRARLAKNPPGPGWADFGWSNFPVAGDTDKLLLLLHAAKDLGLLGRKDRASRLIFFNIAHRYEQAADGIGTWNDKTARYLEKFKGTSEYERFMTLATRRWQAEMEAWLRVATYLKQECDAEGLEPGAWQKSITETAPEFVRFKHRVEKIRLEAEKMTKGYSTRITSNWPGKLAYLLEDVRTRADLWSMALVADISEKTPKEGLKLLTDLYRMDEDADMSVRYSFQTKGERYPPLSPPERRLAREALEALEAYRNAILERNLISFVNRAEDLLDAK
ncbi:hypothetical protein [Fundidesulfovibrio terrae]|uniref:hypothetical protein n=1 Tax=Fundidesulfovibrio terrae TaxID=2922866 RepID=UPI001FAF6A11|nr:hypothetical protein [Fundidesulfovibrio terrae]